jgi:hypothetical protein
MKHSQDKGKNLHKTMMEIEKVHTNHLNALTARLADALWQVRLRDEMLRIITGGDQEIVEAVRRQAIENEIEDGSIHDDLAA